MARYIDVLELEKRIKENIKPETLEEKALMEWCKDECIRQAFALPFVNDALIRADTVRKMQDALEHRIHSKLSYHGWYLKETVIAEIAKEMLGDTNES